MGSQGGTGLDRSTLRSLGGVYAHALVQQVARRGQTVPIEHSFAIVIAAAAKVRAARAAGRRVSATPESVLVRHDGTVELGVARAPHGDDPRDDVGMLCRLLVELLAGADLPGELAAAIAALIDPDRHTSVKELARALAEAARRESLPLSKRRVGRWIRSVMLPHQALTPPVGVDTGLASARSLANGSGTFADAGPFDEIGTGVEEIIEPSPAPPGPRPALLADPPPVVAAAPAPRRSLVGPLALLLVFVGVGAAAYRLYPYVNGLDNGAGGPAAAPGDTAGRAAVAPADTAASAAAVTPGAEVPVDAGGAVDAVVVTAPAVDAPRIDAAVPAGAVEPPAPARTEKSKRRHGKRRGAKRRGR
jgi:hypothetical protein